LYFTETKSNVYTILYGTVRRKQGSKLTTILKLVAIVHLKNSVYFLHYHSTCSIVLKCTTLFLTT
jgi:hypothetical protein